MHEHEITIQPPDLLRDRLTQLMEEAALVRRLLRLSQRFHARREHRRDLVTDHAGKEVSRAEAAV